MKHCILFSPHCSSLLYKATNLIAWGVTSGCSQAVWCWWIWRFRYCYYWWSRTPSASETWEALHINTCWQGCLILLCGILLSICFSHWLMNVKCCFSAFSKGCCSWCRRIYCHRIQTSWNRWDGGNLDVIPVLSYILNSKKVMWSFI